MFEQKDFPHGCCFVRITGGSLPCGRYLQALLTGNVWCSALGIHQLGFRPTFYTKCATLVVLWLAVRAKQLETACHFETRTVLHWLRPLTGIQAVVHSFPTPACIRSQHKLI